MKKLSFVLAMIIALSGVIGLFSAPAYAADDVAFDYEYVVGEGGYATVAKALEAVKTNEAAKPGSKHGIKVTGALTEATADGVIAADVTVYSDAKTAPVVTLTGTKMWAKITGKLTVSNLEVVAEATEKVFNPTAGGTVVIDGCYIEALACALNPSNGAPANDGGIIYMSKADYGNAYIYDSELYAGNRGIFAAAGSTETDGATIGTYNVEIKNSKLDSKYSRGVQVNNSKEAVQGKGNVVNFTMVDSEVYALTGEGVLLNSITTNANIKDSYIEAKSAALKFNKNTAAGWINAVVEDTTIKSTTGYAINATTNGVIDLVNVTASTAGATNAVNATAKTTTNLTINFIDGSYTNNAKNQVIYVRNQVTTDDDNCVANFLGDVYVASLGGKSGMCVEGDYVVNVYGGSFETTVESDNGYGIFRLYDRGVVNIYDGLFTVNGAGSVATGHSTKNGTINIYGGTFVDNGATVDKSGMGSIFCHYTGNTATTAKTWNIYGGKIYTKAEGDFEIYRYADSDEMIAALVERGIYADLETATGKVTACLGSLNNAADSIKVTDIDKTYNGEEYAIAVEITPELDGVDYNSDLFKVKGVQILKGTTPNSPSTVARVLFMVKADQIANYDNLAAWFSTENATCLKLDGEIPAGLLTEYGHNGAFVNETAKTNKVYSSVLAGDVKVAADAGYYFVPVTVNVSNDNFDTDIYLRLFAREDGGEGIAISDVVTLNIAKLFN